MDLFDVENNNSRLKYIQIYRSFLITYRVSDYSQGFWDEIGDVKYRNFETSLSALNELI